MKFSTKNDMSVTDFKKLVSRVQKEKKIKIAKKKWLKLI